MEAGGDIGAQYFEALFGVKAVVGNVHLNDHANVQGSARHFERDECRVERVEDFVAHLPVLPKPPAPRVASGNDSLTTNSMVGIGKITSCAIRSPTLIS